MTAIRLLVSMVSLVGIGFISPVASLSQGVDDYEIRVNGQFLEFHNLHDEEHSFKTTLSDAFLEFHGLAEELGHYDFKIRLSHENPEFNESAPSLDPSPGEHSWDHSLTGSRTGLQERHATMGNHWHDESFGLAEWERHALTRRDMMQDRSWADSPRYGEERPLQADWRNVIPRDGAAHSFWNDPVLDDGQIHRFTPSPGFFQAEDTQVDYPGLFATSLFSLMASSSPFTPFTVVNLALKKYPDLPKWVLADFTAFGDLYKLGFGTHPLTREPESRLWAGLSLGLMTPMGRGAGGVIKLAKSGLFSRRRWWWLSGHLPAERWIEIFRVLRWTPNKVDNVMQAGERQTLRALVELDRPVKPLIRWVNGAGEFVVLNEKSGRLLSIGLKGEKTMHDRWFLSGALMFTPNPGKFPPGQAPKVFWKAVESLYWTSQ